MMFSPGMLAGRRRQTRPEAQAEQQRRERDKHQRGADQVETPGAPLIGDATQQGELRPGFEHADAMAIVKHHLDLTSRPHHPHQFAERLFGIRRVMEHAEGIA